MKHVVTIVMLLIAAGAWGQGAPPAESTYLRNAARVLAREYSSRDVSYVLMDIREGKTIASGWGSVEKLIPAGSLVKPFTAIAYAESHDYRFPEQTCAGGNACWNPRGHGKLDIVHAVALSCNSYFTQLAAKVTAVEVAAASSKYGLSGPSVATSADGLAGRFGEWREAPVAIVRAYAELIGRASQPGIREIVEGMRMSAKTGTAEGAHRAVPNLELLAKTGTAPCTHANHAPGDGFTLLAWPAETPHYVLLVRKHSVPGAQAAILAGKMVRSLESK